MSEFDVLQAAASGMEAQRAALEVAARNVAAAEASPAGKLFGRLVPRFAVTPAADSGEDARFALQDEGLDGDPDTGATVGPVRFDGTAVQPGDEVDAVTEMVSVLDAQRAYEANASVFDLGKRLAERTIDLGRL